MDRIKKIKIKQQDGTLSDYYPIGADAQNIDFTNGYNLDQIVGDINPDEDGTLEVQLSKISDIITPEQFGARGDGITDDTDAIQNAINYCKENNLKLYFISNKYKITNSLNIAGIDININTEIIYTGNDYAFIITEATNYKTINIHKITASNGGGLKIAPETDTSGGDPRGKVSFSFNNINIDLSECKLPTIYMDATEGIVTVCRLSGIRWHSSQIACLYMNLESNAWTNSFLTEIDVYDVDLYAGTNRSIPSVYAKCDSAGITEIEYNLFNVNLESGGGLHHKGKVLDVGLYGCRMIEICTIQGWLTFDGRLPSMTIIGTGNIRPQKIVYNNITSDSFYLRTNMNILDETAQASPAIVHRGGAIIGTNCYKPLYPTPKMKKIKDEDIIDDVYTYNFSNGEGYITGFDLSSLTTRTNLTIKIPYSNTANVFDRPLLIIASAPITNFALAYDGGGTKTVSNFQYATYEFIPYTNNFRYIKLS